jgi:methylmalonyl-CoA/ethylmalonyl-CoA epimerase
MKQNRYGLAFHHLGLGVRHPAKAVQLLKGLGYDAGEAVADPLQRVTLILCTSTSMPAVEVIYQSEPVGPLSAILKKSAAIIYHICYETRDLAGSLKALRDEGNCVSLVSPPKPAILFSGRSVSFYNVQGLGIVEILEGGLR